MAQRQDSIPARSLAEKGAQGDIILGKENKKGQLSAAPQALQAGDSSYKKKSPEKGKKQTKKFNTE